MFNRGGQQRTIELSCGYKITGHPQEVNKKVIRHRKYCKTCIEIKPNEEGIYIPPEFNKTAAIMNGWNGITSAGHRPQQMMTTAVVDGERIDLLVEAGSIEEAMGDARIITTILNKAEKVGGRRRKTKKSNKKNTEKEDLLAKTMFLKVPDDKIDEFLDRLDHMDQPDAEERLAELLASNMEVSELQELIKELEK